VLIIVRILRASALLAAAGMTSYSPALASQSTDRPTSVRFARLDDRCTGQTGYAEFRRALKVATAQRDAVAFDRLFTAKGSMRVNGFSRYSGRDDKRWHSPGVANLWREIDAILGLGCMRDGAKLYLPSVGALAENGAVADETDIALTATQVRRRPAASARAIRRLRRGEIVQRIAYDTPEGWNEIQVGPTSGFVRTTNLRSTHDVMLVLVREGAGWKIAEFAGGV
jgi:hypothetical protein